MGGAGDDDGVKATGHFRPTEEAIADAGFEVIEADGRENTLHAAPQRFDDFDGILLGHNAR